MIIGPIYTTKSKIRRKQNSAEALPVELPANSESDQDSLLPESQGVVVTDKHGYDSE